VFLPDAFAKENQESKGSYPVRINGYCEMLSGISWQTTINIIIDGSWTIENGASFEVSNGSLVECHGPFNLQGELDIVSNSEVWTHNTFTFPSSGVLTINPGLFLCDYHVSSGWINLSGDLTLTNGSLEFPDANISFEGTSTISGGTIIAGRSVIADLAGAFQPTGGKLELIGSSAGHYIQIINGNQPYELHISRSSPIGVHPGSPLQIQSYLIVNSEFMAQSNALAVSGDLAVNTGGILYLNENATLEMANNRWININNGGTLEAVGFPGNEAILSHTTGYYNLMIESGGVISAENAIFEYMGFDGIQIRPGAIVDPVNSFNHCIFQNGYSGGQLVTVENTQDFTVENAIFPTNTWTGLHNVYKNTTPGDITFINATGDFAGEANEWDPNNLVHWGMPEVRLELKVFLEGPFNGTDMNTDLNSILPLDHPFDPPLPYFGNPLPPDWYYTGGGSVGFIPGSTIVDWVLVQLRDATSPGTALPATTIDTVPAFVLNNGNVVGLDGSSLIFFSVIPANNLYAVIWHRNHLGIISANPLIESGGIYSYDFSSSASQAYGGSFAHKQLSTSPEIWGMMAGDADGNGNIQFQDINNVWDVQTGNTGYLESDFNLDTQSNNKDKNEYWLPNEGEGSFIPE